MCLKALLPFTLQSREHNVSPHLAQLGKFEPVFLQAAQTARTRNLEVCSRSANGALMDDRRGECARGVAGASEDDAVASDSLEGDRRRERDGERW